MSFFSKKEKEKKQLNGPSDLDIKAGGEWLNERLSEAARLKTVESGTYFRTHAFHFNKLGIATEEYMEAVYLEPKHAYAGPSWFVQKVVKSKDVSLPEAPDRKQIEEGRRYEV